MLEVIFTLIFIVLFRFIILKFLGYDRKSILLRDSEFWSLLIFVGIALSIFFDKSNYLLYILVLLGILMNVFNYISYRLTFASMLSRIFIFLILLFPKYIWIVSIFAIFSIYRMKRTPIYNWIYNSKVAEQIAKTCEKGEYTRKPIIVFAPFNRSAIFYGKGFTVNVKEDKAIFRISRKTHRLLSFPKLSEFCEKFSEYIRGWLNDKGKEFN
ncbi:MAG TPA: hypothetical protein DER56_02010 [Thermosipho africanus]|nr:hypothetical protein [Thermosipho sp. (in: thermotogales)]HCF37842.1 hypothetical protein [Thermosipho africanus]